MSLKKLAAIGLPLWYTFPKEHLSKLKSCRGKRNHTVHFLSIQVI